MTTADDLLVELRASVDPKLVAAARAARADRIAAECAYEAARSEQAMYMKPSRDQSYAEERAQAGRQQAIATAEATMIAARQAEAAAVGVLGRAVQPVYARLFDDARREHQDAVRAAQAMVEKAHRALKAIEKLDPTEELLKEVK